MAKLRVVGIGPGDYEEMTVKAVNALNACDVIVGYTVYVDGRERRLGLDAENIPLF